MAEVSFRRGHRESIRTAPLRAFAGDEESAFKVGAWFLATRGNLPAERYCKLHSISVERAQSTGSNSVGGFLVPLEMQRAIIAIREVTGAFRAAADVRPMGSDSSIVPRRTSGLTASFTTENPSSIGKSQFGVDGVSLVAKKLTTFTSAANELSEDAIIDLGEFITLEAGYAFAVKEDDCGFNGDGTSAYGGTRGIATLLADGNHNAGKYTASGHATFDAITSTDLSNLMNLAPGVALANGAWFTSPAGFAQIFCRLAHASGGIIMMPDLSGRLRPTYLGFPVILTQAIVNSSPTGKLICAFGDLSLAATVGDRKEVTLFESRHGSGYFETDSSAYRVSERVDINVHDLGDNTTAGPIVGMFAG